MDDMIAMRYTTLGRTGLFASLQNLPGLHDLRYPKQRQSALVS